MTLPFLRLIFYFLTTITFCFCGKTYNDPPKCTICLQVLIGEYSIDAWNNPFHSYHNNDGIFCNSCSRIISQGITHGGYRFTDGRHLCSLCQISMVEDDSVIQTAYKSVLLQFARIGINHIPEDIPITLVNLIELNNIYSGKSHGNLKGFTQVNNKYKSHPYYTIFILFGLPRIEFEAVLAHELMHIWIYINYPNLKNKDVEGLCNAGSALIYINDGTCFSKIHLKAMENNPDSIYGDGYRKMKELLEKSSWNNLLINLHSFE